MTQGILLMLTTYLWIMWIGFFVPVVFILWARRLVFS